MDEKLKNFYEILDKRYSVRKYKKDPVADEVIKRILDVGVKAASAANSQPWQFIICKGKGKESLNPVFYRDGFKDAPVAIAALSKPEDAWIRRQDGKNYSDVDVSIAVTEMILAATAEGLGTCWIAAFDYDAAREILNIPDNMDIVTLLTIGYIHPEDKGNNSTRKDSDDVVLEDKYEK